MREIKLKIMGQLEDNTWIYQIMTLEDIALGWFNQFCATNNLKKDKLLKLQYTGLEDDGGKGIYEGDIVRFDGHIRDERFASPIIFDHGMFRPKMWPEPLGFYKYKNIVGNIYENPELLKDN
jgi:uncharacterized phage protein (TIGR01671 family)